MAEAEDNRSTRSITAEDALKIFHECGLGPSEVTPRIRVIADLLSSGPTSKHVIGPQFQRSKRTFFVAKELLDHLEQEMKWNLQRAREDPQLYEICKAYQGKLRSIADAISSLNDTELLLRAPWAAQNPRLRFRSLVASQVFFILKENDCENLAFPDREDARVIKVTTELLKATAEQGATEGTVRQTVRRLKRGRTRKAKKMSEDSVAS